MGTEAATARPRFRYWLPAAAAPAFLGVAAAFALTSSHGSAAAGQAGAHRTAPSTAGSAASGSAADTRASTKAAATRAAASGLAAGRAAAISAALIRPYGSAATRLTSVTQPSGRPAAPHVSAKVRKYTVKPGDTLGGIARRVYHDDRFWTAIYWANHRHLRYADQITAGQVLTIPARPARAPAAPSALGPAPAPVTAVTVAGGTTAAPVQSPASQPAVSTTGDSAFQSCVIERESGGNAQVMNASGHYGLYQFSASTWAAYGGNPADFGNASVAEQNQVFQNAIAAGGQSNWSLYDGC